MSNKPKSSLPDDTDYIRKAVELADGWGFWDSSSLVTPHLLQSTYHTYNADENPILPQEGVDALAAQLVRQVDASERAFIKVCWDRVEVRTLNGEWHGCGAHAAIAKGADRTMNTIKAIVDSGVLTDREGQ